MEPDQGIIIGSYQSINSNIIYKDFIVIGYKVIKNACYNPYKLGD